MGTGIVSILLHNLPYNANLDFSRPRCRVLYSQRWSFHNIYGHYCLALCTLSRNLEGDGYPSSPVNVPWLFSDGICK